MDIEIDAKRPSCTPRDSFNDAANSCPGYSMKRSAASSAKCPQGGAVGPPADIAAEFFAATSGGGGTACGLPVSLNDRPCWLAVLPPLSLDDLEVIPNCVQD